MKILAVCGFGIGSSLVLKMNLQKAFDKFKQEIIITTSDVASVSGNDAEAIFTSEELADQVKASTNGLVVVVINNFVNQDEINEKVEKFIKSL